MLFNSLEFFIFLPVVFILFWFVTEKKIKYQNSLLLLSSYIFYGWWDWRFLSLIIFSSLVDFYIGLSLVKYEIPLKRKMLLLLSIVVNVGSLAFFKYYNFFIDSLVETISFFGYRLNSNSLDIVLPVGISFYTFQTLSYTIDVYKRKIKPTRDIIAFFAFVSFFPQLVAGPIERATNLLPQFFIKRKFDYTKATDGIRQILWGLLKKIVIADNCAVVVNKVFQNYQDVSSITLITGAVFFAFQIYGDFSGYSDIAIGTSRLFGFNLMKNFAFPYFSRDIAEFWRRWHISLSTWFRDYLYIPLGGSKGSILKKIRNTFIIFLVSGLWHGANWTFLFWGALNALYFLPLLLHSKNRNNLDVVANNNLLPSLKEFVQMGCTFSLTVIAWIFFRAESITIAFDYIKKIIINFKFKIPHDNIDFDYSFLLILCLFIVVEWFQRDKEHALQLNNKQLPMILRTVLYNSIIFIIIWHTSSKQSFIYFQF